MTRLNLHYGDNRDILKTFADNYFTAVVTDPPYGLVSITKRFGKSSSAPAKHGTDGRFTRLSRGFMGETWDGDGIEYDVRLWADVLRVTKPGGYLLSFGGTRTSHKIASAIEDAGWVIQDSIAWIYSTGMPHSLNLAKAIDKLKIRQEKRKDSLEYEPVSEDSKRFTGRYTGLCPAHEPIIVAMKPIKGSFAENALRHGVGGFSIDECRIPSTEPYTINRWDDNAHPFGDGAGNEYTGHIETRGRYPKNVIIDENIANDLDSVRKGISAYYYCAKASPREKRDENGNSHPTTKPIELMRYLVKLVMQPKPSIILDPFCGSGTTGIACALEDVEEFHGIEKAESYINLSKERISDTIINTEHTLSIGGTHGT